MRPDLHVKVTLAHKETTREEVIKVYQTVQQFKATMQNRFGVPPQNMKLYYCDKVSECNIFLADTFCKNYKFRLAC
jgi:hypothetical protein